MTTATWRFVSEPAPVLDALERRISRTRNVAAVHRQGDALVVTSRATPVWAMLLSVVLFPIGLLFLLVKHDRVLHVRTDTGPDGRAVISITGDASPAVSNALVATAHELFPDTRAAWDDD